MLKFDNTHIFTGYLKQLLSSFNLPTCKIYTKDFAKYREQFGQEDPRIIESFDTLIYHPNTDQNSFKKRIASRTVYLKNDEVYYYAWPGIKNGQALPRSNSYWLPAATVFYDKDKNIPGLTRTLNSLGNMYDTATHEYLGDYLRFLRDYYNVDLMSMYNCFNNSICNNIYYRFNHVKNDNTSYTVFDSRDSKYRIYAFPVKLFSDYTVAIDCNQEIEMFCGIYNKTLDTSKKAADLSKKTYKRVNRTFFKQPFIYDKLNVKYWTFEDNTKYNENEYPEIVNNDAFTRWDISNHEHDLKLFIKVPTACKSSIVVLEGDYRGFNDFKYTLVEPRQGANNTEASLVWEYKQNHAILNFDTNVDLNETSFRPIGKLQLLTLNTGESYPFADRLIEYLSNSAITSVDDIADNIKRAQKVMAQNNHYFKIEGLWENKMQKIIYDYMINSGPIESVKSDTGLKLVDKRRGYHPRLGHVSKSTLYDVLGYIDKDAEKWYASWTNEDGKAKVQNSIQNVDIYNGLFDI